MLSSRSRFRELLARYWPALVIFGLWLLFFWPLILGQMVPGFRDSSYLYYPYFQWIDQQLASGEMPLWNPLCGYGYPLVADGTSSVFYPGKLIFFLRFLDYPARYGNFLASHVLLAAGGAFWFSKTMKANKVGATLSAIGYAFGGAVLFQVNNCPYLISAAWLPFALMCVWNMVRTSNWRWVIGGAVCCALMILGGDPQMVYHVGLIALATILGNWLTKRRRFIRSNRNELHRPARWLVRAISRLVLMSTLTGLLAAIQLIPSYVWSQQSERQFFTSPRNIYEIHEYESWPKEQQKEDLWENLLAGSTGSSRDHIHHVYQFSQPPWTVAEMLWPNFSGKLFPINKRWTDHLVGSDRVWNPSLYFGCVIFVLMLLSMRLYGRRRRLVWLTRVGLFFAIASFGWYGPVWLVRELSQNPDVLAETLGAEVGGFYWLMVVFLPKYVLFRYPAKLFVIASLAACVLAGKSCTKSAYRRTHCLFLFEIGAILSLLMAMLGTRLWEWSGGNIDPWPTNFLFGPFAGLKCSQELFFSFMFVFALLIVGRIVFSFSFVQKYRTAMLFALVIIVSVDVYIANEWLIAKVPSTASKGIPPEDTPDESSNNQEMPRLIAERFEQVDWPATTSSERLEEIVQFQVATLQPKHHLETGHRRVDSFASINSVHFQELIQFRFNRPGWKNYHFAFVDSIGREPRESRNRNEVWRSYSRIRGNTPGIDHFVKVIQYRSNRLEFEFEIFKDGWLVIREQFAPGWRATVYNESAIGVNTEIVPVGPFRAINVSQGRHRIVMEYRPTGFYVGAAISLLSWLLVAVAPIWFFRKAPAPKSS